MTTWVVPAKPADPAMLERIYARVIVDAKTCCHTWTGARNSDGHGTMKVGGRTQYVHRLVWRAVFGKMPPCRLVLRHICNNPRCVRVGHPAHVRPGTHSQNLRDQYHARRRGSQVQRQPRSTSGQFIQVSTDPPTCQESV